MERPAPDTFGKRVRELRLAGRLSQKRLAGAAGIDFTYLSKIENGHRRPPRPGVIRALAAALSVGEEELLAAAGHGG